MATVRKIVVRKDGPYLVMGGVPLVRKIPVVSEFGEPLAWRKGEIFETDATYALCRCGQSRDKPFCDGAHRGSHFDGTETADTRWSVERQRVYPGGTSILVKRDGALCTHAGFCANRVTNVKRMVEETADTMVRSQVIAMIEHCPSGALTYALDAGQPDIEPDLPQQVAVVTEVGSSGLIEGPLWVTGGIDIERADGRVLETRNRVMLCGCGRSRSKPLCDGAHQGPVADGCDSEPSLS